MPRTKIRLDQTIAKAPRHGHPRFYDLTRAEESLHERKNKDYAGGGRPLGNFERVATFLSMYPGFQANTKHGVAIVYMLKQLDAAMQLLSESKEGQTESIDSRFSDIGVYAKLIRILYSEKE